MILCHVSQISSFSALSFFPLNLFYLLFSFFSSLSYFCPCFAPSSLNFSSVLIVLPFSSLSCFPLILSFWAHSSASREFVLSTFVKGDKPSLHLIFVVLRVLSYSHYQVLKALKESKSNNMTSFCTLFIRLRESLREYKGLRWLISSLVSSGKLSQLIRGNNNNNNSNNGPKENQIIYQTWRMFS